MTIHRTLSPEVSSVVGSTDAIKELMGLNRYDEHTKGWRYFMFVQDCKKRVSKEASDEWMKVFGKAS